MTTDTKEKKQAGVVTPEFRASYCHLFTPTESDTGKLVYGVTMIFEPDADISALRSIAKAAKIKKFGKDFQGKLRSPFRKGEPDEFDLAKYPEYEGKLIVAARSYGQQPSVVGRDRQPILDQSLVYSGCYGVAYVTAFAYDHPKGGKGISIGLQHFMKTRDGEPLISRVSADDAFEGVSLPDLPETDSNEDIYDDL